MSALDGAAPTARLTRRVGFFPRPCRVTPPLLDPQLPCGAMFANLRQAWSVRENRVGVAALVVAAAGAVLAFVFAAFGQSGYLQGVRTAAYVASGTGAALFGVLMVRGDFGRVGGLLAIATLLFLNGVF